MYAIRTLGHRDAQFAIAALVEAIGRRGEAAVIAVADARGEMIAVLRMDGAGISSLQIAQNKAFTAARLGIPTREVGRRVRSDDAGHDISYFGDSRYIGWGGGIPVMYEGECIGAVAVSGLPEDVDIELCTATVDRVVAQLLTQPLPSGETDRNVDTTPPPTTTAPTTTARMTTARMTSESPNFGALLAPILTRVDAVARPRFLALLERTAADRYRLWASQLPVHADVLLACAAREDEIADRVEAVFAIDDETHDELRALLPEARDLYYAVFDGRDIRDQIRMQADAELQGANAWRSIASRISDPVILSELARCSELEEASSRAICEFLDADAVPDPDALN